MKKWIALVLVFLLSIISVTAVAEVDLSSYTDAELHELLTQIDSEICRRCYDEGKGKAVCDAFIERMQELGHSLELTSASDDIGFFFLLDSQLDCEEIILAVNGGFKIVPPDNFAAKNESYIRDCMVALAMAVAQIDGVEMFYNEIGTAMRDCMFYLPNGFFTDNIYILWDSNYGYRWLIASKSGSTVISVR